MNGIDGVRSVGVFDTEYFIKDAAYNVNIKHNEGGVPERLNACILTHITDKCLIFTYLPDNGGRNIRVSLDEYVGGAVSITKLVPGDGIDTRLHYSVDSSSESSHFDKDEFVAVFDEVFGEDRHDCIEKLIRRNGDTFKTDSFILSFSPCNDYYIIDTARCVVVGWYPQFDYKYNTCSHRDFTLDNLRTMLDLLRVELNNYEPDGWGVIENKTDTEENKNG